MKPRILNEDSIKLGVPQMERIRQLIDPTSTVEVYKNLHNGLWSVRQRGIVKCHTDYILLTNITFAVQPAGRARVIKEQKKNVHAFVRGTITDRKTVDAHERDCIVLQPRYNPYDFDSFVDGNDDPLHTADFCDMMTGEPLIAWQRAPKTQKTLF